MKSTLRLMLTTVILFLIPNINFGQTAPTLGTTSSFALFTATGAFSVTGASSVTGNVGTHVGAFTGFPPGTLVGQIHVADPVSTQAATDVAVAYNDLTQSGTVILVGLGNGQILLPGVYQTGAASTLNGNLTLDGGGDPNALFIIRIGGAFATGASSTVTLTNLASLCNVYWQIGGQFDLETGSVFRGTLVVDGPIHLLGNSSLLGRGLSTAGAISLDNNVVTNSCACVAPGAPTVSTITQPTNVVETGSVVLKGLPETGTWTVNPCGITGTGTSTTISGLKAGTYNFTVTNAAGCTSSASANVIITTQSSTLAAPTVTLIQPTCLVTTGTITVMSPKEIGMTYSIDNSTYINTTGIFTLVMPGTYTVTSKNSKGGISAGTIVTIRNTEILIGCVSAGTTVTINAPKILLGCISTGTIVTINTQPVPPKAPAITLIQPTCIEATGTITVVSPTETGMTYSINGSTYTNTTGIFTLVPAGTYNITSKNSNECISAGTIVTIKASEISWGCVSTGTIVTINTQPAIPAAPDAIKGTAAICNGQKGLIFSVPVITNATDYVWTLLTGATITAGANTNSITVDFSDISSSGNITVQGSNSCATGTVSAPFKVVVNNCGNGHQRNINSWATSQNEFGLKVYPNPFTDHLCFELQLEKDAKVRLEIFSIKGYKVATVFSENVKAFNYYRMEYTPENNNSTGVLMYRLIIDKQLVLTGKLIHK